MAIERNPLDWPSSRIRSREINKNLNKDTRTEHYDIYAEEHDAVDPYNNNESTNSHDLLAEIPDEGPLPDEFEEETEEEKIEKEKEAYIDEYNKKSGKPLMDEEIDDEEDEKDKEDESVGEYEEYGGNNEYDVNYPEISDIKDDAPFSDGNYRNKEGMRYGIDDDGERARQPYNKGLSSDRPIRVAKKNSIYRKSA